MSHYNASISIFVEIKLFNSGTGDIVPLPTRQNLSYCYCCSVYRWLRCVQTNLRYGLKCS